ncbi:hypothetical protein [Paludibaculum fermentans]|uniref:hypothetical protein n=1 Tax=Paludibaculum fermentans TaxID=1473598 RepID=UPI003EB993EA
MQEYVTAFEVSGESSNSSFGLLGLVLVLAAGIVISAKLWFKWRQPHWIVPFFLCAFGLIWIYLGIWFHNEGLAAMTALQSGRYSIVEGMVTDFHPMPYNGHDAECFSVRSKRFCYSDYDVSPGFRNAASHGGPIRPGLSVRVTYFGPTILRLEVAKDQMPTALESRIAAELSREQVGKQQAGDPVLQAIETAFAFVAAGMTLLWNLQWKWTMGFWLRPPYQRATEYAARAFFGLCLIGSLSGLIDQLRRYPLTRQNLGPTALATAILCLFVGLLIAFVFWTKKRRDHATTGQADNTPT